MKSLGRELHIGFEIFLKRRGTIRGVGSNVKLGGHYIIRAPFSLKKGIFPIVLS